MAHQPTMLALGTKAPDFALPDVATGRTVTLADFAHREALLVVFLCAHCPYVVHVQPVQVVEIAVDGVQASSRYPGGVALRFARVRQYRADKSAAQADSIESVQALLRGAGR